MTNVNIGDLANTINGNRVRISGFYKFTTHFDFRDDFAGPDELEETLEEIIKQEIKDGTYVPQIPIIPCNRDEAHLVATVSGEFYDINDITTVDEPMSPDEEPLIREHQHRVETYAKMGMRCAYGRMKLPTDRYPRLFNKEGQLIT